MTRARANSTRALRGARVLGRSISLVAIALFFSSNLHAENPPSVWARAKDPDAEARYQLHVRVENELESGGGNYSLRELGAQRAKMMLEQAHVADMPDVTLRIDLGRAYEKLHDEGRAAVVLSKALALDPKNPEAELGWNVLAYAYAHLDRPDEELYAYGQYLKLETNVERRASTTLNMAEAEMRQGHLREAIVGYRDAIRLAEGIRTGGGLESYVLSIWGLCVALDRNGDSTGALIEANRAASHDPRLAIISDTEGVFFVPAYERFYYQGMGELAIAGMSASEREKAEHYDKAERRFREYVNDATEDDRWITRAKSHLRFAESKIKTKDPKVARDPAPKDLKL